MAMLYVVMLRRALIIDSHIIPGAIGASRRHVLKSQCGPPDTLDGLHSQVNSPGPRLHSWHPPAPTVASSVHGFHPGHCGEVSSTCDQCTGVLK